MTAAAAKESKLLAPAAKPLAVSPGVRQEVMHARGATCQVVMLSGALVDSLTQVTARMAGQVGKSLDSALSDNSSAAGGGGSIWKADAQALGQSTVGAGLGVFSSLSAATDRLVQDAAGGSADVLGHKYGKEVGELARDGIHVGGNLLAVKGQLAPKAVLKHVATESAASLVSPHHGGTPYKGGHSPGFQLGPTGPPAVAGLSASTLSTPAQGSTTSTGILLGPGPASSSA
ncbi:unnamed protein product [Polarella glacialis]|nr:unnamed protein product [Polarella glacialis]